MKSGIDSEFMCSADTLSLFLIENLYSASLYLLLVYLFTLHVRPLFIEKLQELNEKFN